MKIGILSAFYPLRGGIAQFSACLYRSLSEAHEVKAWTFSRQYPGFLYPGKTQYVQPGDHADPIPSVQSIDSMNPLTWRSAAREIRSFTPDVFISNYWMSYLAPCMGYIAARQQPARRIAVMHNAIPHEPKFWDRPLTRYFLRQHDGFLAMSNRVEQDLLLLQPGAKVARQDHPIYDHFGARVEVPEARRQLGLHPEKKTLLFFGFIRHYKGLDVLIRAFAELADSYQLVIAGEVFGSFEEYQQLIDAHPRKADIHVFARYIPDHEVPLFFSASDVCVLPYRDGTQSGITSIAYHFNTPLVATRVGGLPETIEPYGTGLVVDRVEPHDIAEGIRAFYAAGVEAFASRIPLLKDKTSWTALAKVLTEFAGKL